MKNLQFIKSVRIPAVFERNVDTGKFEETKPEKLLMVYRDLETKKKFYEIIENPIAEFYIKKPEYFNEFNKDYAKIEECDYYKLKNKDLLLGIAIKLDELYDKTGKEKVLCGKSIKTFKEFYNKASKKEKGQLHLDPNIFGSDTDIEDVYIRRHFEKYPNYENNYITKGYFDIETDVYQLEDKKPDEHLANATINMISYFNDEFNHCYLFLLSDPINPKSVSFCKAEEKKKEIIEKLSKQYDESYALKTKFIIVTFKDELELICSLFDRINEDKPDYCSGWNFSFDLLTIINRLKNTYKVDPATVICPKEMVEDGIAYQYYREDVNAQDFSTDTSYFLNSSYTKYICQLRLFANLRASLPKRLSYTLNAIANEEIGDSKVDLQKEGVDVVNAPYLNYELFVEYSGKDTMLLHLLESKIKDIDLLQSLSDMTRTRYHKANAKTISFINTMYVFGKNAGVIQCNNINKDYGQEKPSSESFSAALVADPNLNSFNGTTILGQPSKYHRGYLIDEDFSSMYPNSAMLLNLSKATMLMTFKFVKEDLDLTSDLVDDIVSRQYYHIGQKYLGLPEPKDFIQMIISNVTDNTVKPSYEENDILIKTISDEMYNNYFSYYDKNFTEQKDRIKSIIYDLIKLKIKKGDKISLFNNKKQISGFSDIYGIVTFILKIKPIVSGSGCIFEQHRTETFNMLTKAWDFLLKERKKFKKLMFKNLNEPKLYELYDTIQKVYKILANGGYGCLGNSTSKIFDINLATSITYTCVQLISFSIATFEKFMQNNIKYNNINDMLHSKMKLLKDKKQLREYTDNDLGELFGELDLTKEKVYSYLLTMFKNDINDEDKIILKRFIDSLNNLNLHKVYLHNQLFVLLNLSKVKELASKLFMKEFLENKSPSEEFTNNKNLIWEYIFDFVLDEHQEYDAHARAKYDNRKSVCVTDTDSTFIDIMPWMNYIESIIGKKHKDLDNKYVVSHANIITEFITNAIVYSLNNFCINVGCEDADIRTKINMKSEFLYSNLLLTTSKKRYCGVILSVEGNVLPKPKLDMKGVNLRKKSLSKKISDRVTNEVLLQEILKPEVNLIKVLQQVRNIENDVKQSLKEGRADYSIPAKCNKPETYKNPYSIMVLRAVNNYNDLKLSEMPIILPTKVFLFKLKKDYLNNEYISQDIKDRITNILNERPEEYSKYGFDVIALPMYEESLDERIRGLIDYELMTNDAVRSSVTEILEPLGLKPMVEDGKTFVSTIVNF